MKINLLKLLRLQKNNSKNDPEPSKDILCLWEADSLMREILPFENLEFIKAETKRINDFGEEHREELGFSDITEIGEKPVKTVERLINITDIETIMTKSGLEKVNEVYMQGVGVLEGEKTPLAYGTNKFAILFDKQGTIVKNISITGWPETEDDKERIISALLILGQEYNFLAVNWYQGEYYNLIQKQNIEAFINS